MATGVSVHYDSLYQESQRAYRVARAALDAIHAYRRVAPLTIADERTLELWAAWPGPETLAEFVARFSLDSPPLQP